MERNEIPLPAVLFLDNGDIITSPHDIANIFNRYFASIAETTRKVLNTHLNIF